ncbi:acyl-CoA thioesterase [Siphonobacter aquaeclarae]|jgi:acyl-CoA thioester hydrolase|uniref:Acyl-CoA thioester hydrolase n=1 Tax=Siphonobacter aquaeclarae TaxID=563176 RepID=A0A1G9TDB2_9BACT|nr:thioesterase family protein [Siphonobacter aquaeclarae]MBO9636765.1 acyl-CoA thioesterase [Siphonobacter aquaeclarae]SDM45614.1 acyl-CoA thioester hydrolase [Siphonobacter aquaeclarae]
MYTHDTTYRVCYADTDQMGYMYYGNYARLYEIGRVEALRSLGFRYRELEESGIMMPVYEMKTRYLQPAKYDELITVRTMITKLPSVRIAFQFELFNEENTLINTGEVTLVFVNMTSGRPVVAPAGLQDILRPHFAGVPA